MVEVSVAGGGLDGHRTCEMRHVQLAQEAGYRDEVQRRKGSGRIGGGTYVSIGLG